MNKNKKGFTIVELVIVIAIIAILAAILIPTFANIIRTAHISADTQLIRNLNTALTVDSAKNGKHTTMQSALDAAESAGYLVDRINASATDNEILWDSKNDVFCYFDTNGTADESDDVITYIPETTLTYPVNEGSTYDDTKVNTVDYFVISDMVNAIYSTYYTGTETDFTGENAISKGFDAGTTTGITAIEYKNDSAQNVVIRTNSASTTLTINAEHDTIHHYDALGALNIVKANTASYHENGKVAYVEIAYGRIVLERGADVEEIHINKKENEQAFDTVIIANNGGAEELPKRITRDAVTVTEQKLVVTVESNGSSEQVFVYVNGTTGTTEKVTEGVDKQNENVNSALGQLVLDNGSAGEKAQTISEKETAKTEAVENAKADEKFDTAIVATKGSSVIECSLAEFRDRVNGLNGFEPESFEGYTITLAASVDLKNEEWAPIGTKEHPFRGKFDGANYAIKNLNVNSTTGYAGLFGVVVGSYQNTPRLVSDVWDDSNRAMKENGYSENKFTAVVKNLTIDGFTLNSSSSNYHGTLAGYAVDAYFANITVKNGTVSTKGKAGGVIGSITGSVVFDTLKTESSVFVNATGHTAGGIIAGTNRNYTDNYDGVAFTVAEQNGSHVAVIVNCENNATVTGVGYTGGIVGQAGNTRGLEVVIYNCVNNGSVSQSSSNTNPMGGIVAATHSTYDSAHAVISNCTNNGTLTHTTTSTASDIYIAGIDAYGTNTKIYNCVNTGSVTGYATKVAGIAAGLSSTYSEIVADSCSNTGTILNTNQNGQTYDVYGGDWSKMDFDASASSASSVSDIQALLNSSNIARQYNFVGYGSIAGTLTIDKALSNIVINADSRICSSIVIEGNRNQTITLNIPNLECTLSGNMSNVCLIIQGENSSITVAEETSLKELRILNGTSFTNNGTVSKLQLTDIPTATNNGTLGFVTITVSGENTITNFTNNNTITAQAPRNNVNLIECAGNGTVNLLNNGTINYDFEDAPSGATSYIFLCKYLDSVTLNVKCSATSVIDGYQDKDWFCMFTASSANNYTVKYLEGAQFTVNGSVPSTRNYNQLVGRYQQVDSLD